MSSYAVTSGRGGDWRTQHFAEIEQGLAAYLLEAERLKGDTDNRLLDDKIVEGAIDSPLLRTAIIATWIDRPGTTPPGKSTRILVEPIYTVKLYTYDRPEVCCFFTDCEGCAALRRERSNQGATR